jgi:DNA-binding response OmpR family regulator
MPSDSSQTEVAVKQQPDDILIVDDEVPIAQFIATVLQEEGYAVRVVHDGASALLEIVARPPCVVLLDVAMPVMVGDELLRYLRRKGFSDLPIIMMTAGLYPEAYLSQGATDILPKPFDVELLIDKVARYMPPQDQARAR